MRNRVLRKVDSALRKMGYRRDFNEDDAEYVIDGVEKLAANSLKVELLAYKNGWDDIKDGMEPDVMKKMNGIVEERKRYCKEFIGYIKNLKIKPFDMAAIMIGIDEVNANWYGNLTKLYPPSKAAVK